jgi:hypothetical protein
VEEHVAEAPVPLRLQVEKVPVTPVSDSVSVPVGVVGVDDVSVTVTLQVEPTLMSTGEVQLTVVVVVCSGTVVTAIVNCPLLRE